MSTGCGYQTLLLPGSQLAGQELGTKHTVSAGRHMQAKQHGFAEFVFHLARTLFLSFWIFPSSLSPILCSWNNRGKKQAHLGLRWVTMGIVLTSSP